MIPRSILAVLLAAATASTLAVVGCAAPTESSDEPELSESEDNLTSTAAPLIGSYWTSTPTSSGISRLNLKADGTFHASVDGGPAVVCITSPCLLPEDGRWNAIKRQSGPGAYRIRLRPDGQPSRWYDATLSAGVLTLRRSGVTQTLAALGTDGCLDDTDCSADEACGPKLCLMWCAVGDPFCCGPSTCRPKPPAPGNDCMAALCGPGTVCVEGPTGAQCVPTGESCGAATCAVGEVCCNPLAGICTPPGGVCAM